VSRGGLHEFLVSLHWEFGSVASFWFGGRQVVSLGAVQQLRQHINPNCTSQCAAVISLMEASLSRLKNPLIPLSSADSFETMLKSLLGYRLGAGGDAAEAVMRRKVYENAVNATLKSNFPLMLKVRVSVAFTRIRAGGGGVYFPNPSCRTQLAEELLGKWRSFPESQHTPLCAHLLGLAMKTVTQLALGESFGDDAKVLSFRKNHNAVRRRPPGAAAAVAVFFHVC